MRHNFVKKDMDEKQGIVCGYEDITKSLMVVEITKEWADVLAEQVDENHCSVPKEWNFDRFSCQYILFLWNGEEEVKLYFTSASKRIRAVEYLDYLIPEFGLVKGNGAMAEGRISQAILEVQMSDVDISEPMEYFLMKSQSYFQDCDSIEAGVFGKEHASEIQNMTQYQKKQVPWAYVKSTDIWEAGAKIFLKSLENESGLELVVSEDVYLMIGCRGEMYDIKREKFETTYEATETVLDVFEQMLDFLPEVQDVKTGEYISVDEWAHLCYPKKGSGIYATQLKKRTKVFPNDSEQEYYLGRPGDYLAVRPDDFCDIYVIEGEIFKQTYE